MGRKIASLDLITITLAILIPVSIIYFADFNGLYGQDSYVYELYARSIFSTSQVERLPTEFHWPKVYPLLGAFVGSVLPGSESGLQMISVLSLAVLTAVNYRLCKNFFKVTDQIAFGFVLICVVLSPYLVRFSLLRMSDLLCASLVLTTFYFSLNRKSLRSGLILIGIIIALAVFHTRYVAGLLVIGPVIQLIIELYRRRSIALLTTGMATLTIVTILSIHEELFSSILQHPVIENWSLQNFNAPINYHSDSVWLNLQMTNALFYPFQLFHPKFLLISIPLFAASFWRFDRNRIQLLEVYIPLIAYLIFLMGTPFSNPRLLIPIYPLLLICIFPGYEWIAEKLNRVVRLSSLAIIVCIQIALIVSTVNIPILWSAREHAAILNLEIFNKKNLTVCGSGLDGAIAYYLPETNYTALFNLSGINELPEQLILVINEDKQKSIEIQNQTSGILNNIFEEYHLERKTKISDQFMAYEIYK